MSVGYGSVSTLTVLCLYTMVPTSQTPEWNSLFHRRDRDRHPFLVTLRHQDHSESTFTWRHSRKLRTATSLFLTTFSCSSFTVLHFWHRRTKHTETTLYGYSLLVGSTWKTDSRSTNVSYLKNGVSYGVRHSNKTF